MVRVRSGSYGWEDGALEYYPVFEAAGKQVGEVEGCVYAD
jgi:hypothetical protein